MWTNKYIYIQNQDKSFETTETCRDVVVKEIMKYSQTFVEK